MITLIIFFMTTFVTIKKYRTIQKVLWIVSLQMWIPTAKRRTKEQINVKLIINKK